MEEEKENLFKENALKNQNYTTTIKVMKIIFSIIILFSIFILLFYGTLSPCEILKKEIAKEAKKDGELGLYIYLVAL